MAWNEPYNDEEIHTVIEPTQIFNLKQGYHPGLGDLTVFFNGVVAVRNQDYLELNALTVQFTFDVIPEDVIIFRFQNLGW